MKKLFIIFLATCLGFNTVSFADDYQKQAENYVNETLKNAKKRGEQLMIEQLVGELHSLPHIQWDQLKSRFTEDLKEKLINIEVLTNKTRISNLGLPIISVLSKLDETFINNLNQGLNQYNQSISNIYVLENSVLQNQIAIDSIESNLKETIIQFVKSLNTDCDLGIGENPNNPQAPKFKIPQAPPFYLGIDFSFDNGESEPNSKFIPQFRQQHPQTIEDSLNGKSNDEKYAEAGNYLLNLAPTYLAGVGYSYAAGASLSHSLLWMLPNNASTALLLKASLTGMAVVVAIAAAIYLYNREQEIKESRAAADASDYMFQNQATYEDVKKSYKRSCEESKKIFEPLLNIDLLIKNPNFVKEQLEQKDKLLKFFEDQISLKEKMKKKELEILSSIVNLKIKSMNKEDNNNFIKLVNQGSLTEDQILQLSNIWLGKDAKPERKKNFADFCAVFSKLQIENRIEFFKLSTILFESDEESFYRQKRQSIEYLNLVTYGSSLSITHISKIIFIGFSINYIESKKLADEIKASLKSFSQYFSTENMNKMKIKNHFLVFILNKKTHQLSTLKNSVYFSDEINSSTLIRDLYIELDQIIYKMVNEVFTDKRENESLYHSWYVKLLKAQQEYPQSRVLINLKEEFELFMEKRNEI